MAYQIKGVRGREILSSRANSAVEAGILLENGVTARAAVPSSTSTGQFEASELRDKNPTHFDGKGVRKAVENINTIIRNRLVSMNVSGVATIDAAMPELDGTKNKSNLGASTILAVSLAATQTAAKAQGVPLYRFLDGAASDTLPVPMMNVLNDDAHTANGVDIQEFMIMPVGTSNFREGLHMCTEVFHTLASILKKENLFTSISDEGDYAPNFGSGERAVQYLLRAIEAADYKPCGGSMLAIDAAASEWKSEKGTYLLPKSQKHCTANELISFWEDLVSKYPIAPLEDTLDKEDWEGWKKLTARLGDKLQLIGDDLFVTNTRHLQKGIENGYGNSVLIKLDQIGSLTKTLDVVKMAHSAGCTATVPHRSDETEDITIADLAVAMNTDQIKTGAPSRSGRAARYNQLLRIEEDLGDSTRYPGRGCYDCK